jgi:putative transcriptional regulator
MSISNEIKKLRTDREVTQEQLADAVGVSRQTIVAIEKGNYTPSLMLGMQLARFFRVGVEELFHLK